MFVYDFLVTKDPVEEDPILYEENDEQYDDEDYESTPIDSKSQTSEDSDQKVVKIVKQEDRKAAVPVELLPTSTKAPPTPTTTATPPTQNNRNNNVNTSRTSQTFSQNSPTQKQTTVIANPNGKSRLTQKQNGQTVTSFPSTTSTSAPSITPTPTLRTRFLPSKHVINLQKHKNATSDSQQSKPEENTSGTDENPKSYVSVTKSVMGSIDNTKTPAVDKQNFESTYYTKSSTCGFFTKSCNMVYGPNGRHKVCKPIAPVNGKC